ncbi:MAG: hypothetical protein JWO71_3124 [Candidatus Acidoferrum typicum]|nr:hypothetical protein [Candidatus Acidoferrum typicum]
METAKLTKFLYVLMRDRLPLGAVQSIVDDYCEFAENPPPLRPQLRYTNSHLEAYARELAGRLTRV